LHNLKLAEYFLHSVICLFSQGVYVFHSPLFWGYCDLLKFLETKFYFIKLIARWFIS
jgi:hypothetical protein